LGIIVRFILKNIYGKKLRTLLILFSIILSTALFFASMAIGNTIMKMYEDRIKQFYGQTDIRIQPTDGSPTQFMSLDNAKKYSADANYIVGVTETNAFYKYKGKENVSIDLLGFDMEDLNVMNPVSYNSKGDVDSFSGQKIIISKNTADKYHILLGSNIEMYLGGEKYIYKVCGISNPTGVFTDDGRTIRAVVPKDFIEKKFNQVGKANIICIKLKDTSKIQTMIKKLSKEYPKYYVGEPISSEDLKNQLGSISTPFLLMSIIVSYMSIYIIYSSFKVITIERLPIIGTFRSIGATRKMTDFVLILESFIYGVLGGILGCGLGIGILYIMSYMTRPVWEKGFHATILFTPFQLGIAFLGSIVLCVVSSIMPIIKVSKTPVKDIVMNSYPEKKRNRKWKLILAVLFLLLALFLPKVISKDLALLVDTTCMLFAVFSAILLVPYLSRIFVFILSKLLRFFLGNEGILAAKNIKGNKGILSSMSLLIIGISAVFMINTVSFSVIKELSNLFSAAHYEIIMNVENTDQKYMDNLKKIDGIKAVCGSYGLGDVEVIGQNTRIQGIQGTNPVYMNYWSYDIPGGYDKAVKALDKERTIILTNFLQKKFNVKAGDIITLKLKGGNFKYKVYDKFFDTLESNGSYALISSKYLVMDDERNYIDTINIRTSKNPDTVVESIKNNTYNKIYFISTMKELEKLNVEGNAQMFNIMKGFALLTLIIGIFGIINNLLISFIERRRSLAVFKSVGMSRKQMVKMIFVEALSGGLMGSTVGLATGFLMVYIVPFVTKAIDKPIPIYYSMENVISSFIIGVVIMLLASIIPAFKSSKLNIIESIKYE